MDGGVELEMLPGQDIRPVIARTVVTGNFDLIELRQVSLSLEDIFIELTREEPAPPSIVEEAGLAEPQPPANAEDYLEE